MSERMKDGIIKRGAVYYYVVREKDPKTGKTKQRWVRGVANREATKGMRDAARNAVRQGTYVAPQDETVGAYLDRWLDAHEGELKPSTAHSYRQKINSYLKPTVGHIRVQELSPSRLSVVWKQQLHKHGGESGKPLSRRSVEFARAVLRRAMADAVVDRVIMVNPVVGSKLPKYEGKPKHTTWTGEQAQAFLAATADTRLAPLWQLALASGMRRGEMMALTWENINLDTGIADVEWSATQVGNKLVTTTPKNHESRKIQLDARTVAVLRAWRKVQAEERLAWGAAYEDTEGIVFTWENGQRVSPNAVSKAFLRAQAGLGLPRITMHETRHTHATVLLRDGVPVHIVSRRLGHKDPSVTLNVYADVIPNDDSTAVDVFSRAVWGAR
jgi:integrase